MSRTLYMKLFQINNPSYKGRDIYGNNVISWEFSEHASSIAI